MLKNLTIDELRARATAINQWLDVDANPDVHTHAHLDRSTPECAYFHLGYQQALTDIVKMITNAAPQPCTSDMSN
jgi:hypothetical protein